jgi:hypothetical protein
MDVLAKANGSWSHDDVTATATLLIQKAYSRQSLLKVMEHIIFRLPIYFLVSSTVLLHVTSQHNTYPKEEKNQFCIIHYPNNSSSSCGNNMLVSSETFPRYKT